MIASEGGLLRLLVQGSDMSESQVCYMDVISNTGAIFGVVISTEDIQVGQMAAGNSLDVWHEVVWGASRVFADEAGFMSSNGIKISEANR